MSEKEKLQAEFEQWCVIVKLSTKRIGGTGGKWDGRYYAPETEAAWQCLCEFKLPPESSERLLFKNQKGVTRPDPQGYA